MAELINLMVSVRLCLYSRLAELEIAKFQDQVIKRLRDDMVSQLDGVVTQGPAASGSTSPITGAMILHHEIPPNEIEWTLPKAFLYSLTVLTTIGEWKVSAVACHCLCLLSPWFWSWARNELRIRFLL